MGRKLLIVASKRYGDYVKEIAESMGCFEEISFVDNDREGAIGKLEDVESFYPEYNCAIADLSGIKSWRYFTIFQFYFIWILLFLHQLI